jgi:hypothetical protein
MPAVIAVHTEFPTSNAVGCALSAIVFLIVAVHRFSVEAWRGLRSSLSSFFISSAYRST